MEKAFFINIRSEIIQLLNQANKEVVIAMAWFTSNELFQVLLSSLRKNVKVELVLLDHATNFMSYAPDFNRFIEAGGTLRIAKVKDGFMHHKFCVIDDRFVITGSYNWTYSAETRNIENIIITDKEDVVLQYKEEFNTLLHQAEKVTESPRLSWEDIEAYPSLNFEELNYEIENIARVRNLPVKKVVKSSTVVTVEERPINPISKYDIGIKVTKKEDNCSMMTFIPAGTKLPFTSKPVTLYNYSDHRNYIECAVLYVAEGVKKFIVGKAITDITSGRNDWELTIRVQFTLLPSGDLYAEIRCVETGKVMNIKATNSIFVDYAE